MFLRKILQPVYTAYAIVSFAIVLIVTCPFLLLLSLGNNAASRRAIYSIMSGGARIWLLIAGMPLRISGDRRPPGRHIVVANHISYLDTVMIFPALPGYFRPLGKKEFARVPVVGYIYSQITILVNRSSAESRSKSMRLMWRMLKHEGDILIFPEGTFNETGELLREFYDGAFRLALSTHTPILPVVFPDTVHRWHYSAWWKLWPGINRAVFLPPVSVAGLGMNDLPALKQRVADAMAAELSKYDYPGV